MHASTSPSCGAIFPALLNIQLLVFTKSLRLCLSIGKSGYVYLYLSSRYITEHEDIELDKRFIVHQGTGMEQLGSVSHGVFGSYLLLGSGYQQASCLPPVFGRHFGFHLRSNQSPEALNVARHSE